MTGETLERELKELLGSEVKEEASRIASLEERIVSELSGRLPRMGLADVLRQLVAPTRLARLGQLAVVGATAVVFLLFGVFLADRLPRLAGGPGVAGVDGNEVLFVMPAIGAESVSVVGSFNNWEATALFDTDGDGIWTKSIPLVPGRYEYAFVVDGKWWGQDPLADEYVRSFGDYNSVRYVGRAGDEA